MLSNRISIHFVLAALLFTSALHNFGFSQLPNEPTASRPVDASRLFREQIAPVLISRCQACHGSKQEGGYSVVTPEKLFVPGDSQARPVVGKVLNQSELWLRLISEDTTNRMPLDAPPLTKEQLAAFRKWIEAGAPVDANDKDRSLSSIAISRIITAPDHYLRPIAINALAISKNAETVWVSGYAEVTNWRVTTGELLARVPVAGPHVAAIALVPDQSCFLVSSGLPGQRGVIELIKTNDSKAPPLALEPTVDVAPDLAVTKDGQRVAIGGQDGSLRVVELLSDQRFGQTLSMTPHADAILAVAWSADGKRLVSGSRDRTAKLYESAKMELIASYDRHERAVGGVGFVGKRPISLDETGRIRMMPGDDSDGVVAEQSGLPRVLQRFVTESDKIFIAEHHRLREFHVESKTIDDGKDDAGKPKTKNVTRFREGNILAVDAKDWITSVAASDSALAVGTQQGTIAVWDRSTGQRLGVFLAKP